MVMRRRRMSRLAVTVAAVVVLAPAVAGAMDKVRELDSVKESFDVFPVHQALEEGYFKQENLDVDVIYGQGGASALQAIITGSRDIGVGIGSLAVIGAYAKGAPVVILGSTFKGADNELWYVRADSPIKSVKDLEGKTMVYSSPGSTSNIAAAYILKTTGVKAKLVAVGGMAASRTMVMSGQVDTGWLGAPSELDLVRTGKARIIVGGDQAGELRTMTIRVIVAYRPWLEKHRDVAKRFMQAFWKGRQFNYSGEKAIERYAKMWKMDMREAREAPKYVPPATTTLGFGNLAGVLKLAQEYKFLRAPLSKAKAEKMIDYVYMPDPDK